MRRARDRPGRFGMKDLHASARRHCVRRIIVGNVRTKQMWLSRQDGFGLSCLVFGGRIGKGHGPTCMALRYSEQRKRQHDKKPRQNRGRSYQIAPRRACHPWAAHT